MAKPNHHSLRGIHEGRVAAILGAAETLPDDFACVPDDALLFSVNYHGAMFTERYGVDCDYLVFNDASDPLTAAPWHGVRLSMIEHQSEVDIRAFADPGFSAATAALLACWMGCDPVVLCGMDCYTGERLYWHDLDVRMPNGARSTLDHHVRAWSWCFDHFDDADRIVAMPGPLVGLFGPWLAGVPVSDMARVLPSRSLEGDAERESRVGTEGV